MKLTHQSPSLREQQSQTYIHRSWHLTISAGGPGGAISAAEPTHCNEIVSFTRTAVALAWRGKIIRPRRRGWRVFCWISGSPLFCHPPPGFWLHVANPITSLYL